MDAIRVFQLISLVLGIFVTVTTTFVPLFFKSAKARRIALAAADKAQKAAETADKFSTMLKYCETLIADVEDIFKAQDTALKSVNKALTLGPVKKESALSKLLAKSIEIGFSFDQEFWSKQIDHLVTVSRRVALK